MNKFSVPLIIRGEIIDEATIEYGGRTGGVTFTGPDVSAYLSSLRCEPSTMSEMNDLSVEEILLFLSEVGRNLDIEKNQNLRTAFEVSKKVSGLSASVLESLYRAMPNYFGYDLLSSLVDTQIGREYLEGWVSTVRPDGAVLSKRAMGARAAHVIAGNTPSVAIMTIIRSAITRSDSIIKLPSNDPLTATAILQTMIEVGPNHPITRHTSAAYWKGGAENVEAYIYSPRNIEKIVAWGGKASIGHITKYLQPGIDLITLDPKHSASIIGSEALASDESIADVAKKAALDIGAFNQELCANARVLYVVCDVDDQVQLDKLNELGQRIFDEIQLLPSQLSTATDKPSLQLADEVASLAMQDDFFSVFQGGVGDGAVIVSHEDECVEFSDLLANRTANLVPVPSIENALRRITSASQSVGVYPDSLKEEIRDALAYQGAQHICPLGGVMSLGTQGPQDGLEIERRMMKWIKDISLPKAS